MDTICFFLMTAETQFLGLYFLHNGLPQVWSLQQLTLCMDIRVGRSHPHLTAIDLISQIPFIRLATHTVGLSAFPETLAAQLSSAVLVLTEQSFVECHGQQFILIL